jgi:hypothetical protein
LCPELKFKLGPPPLCLLVFTLCLRLRVAPDTGGFPGGGTRGLPWRRRSPCARSRATRGGHCLRPSGADPVRPVPSPGQTVVRRTWRVMAWPSLWRPPGGDDGGDGRLHRAPSTTTTTMATASVSILTADARFPPPREGPDAAPPRAASLARMSGCPRRRAPGRLPLGGCFPLEVRSERGRARGDRSRASPLPPWTGRRSRSSQGKVKIGPHVSQSSIARPRGRGLDPSSLPWTRGRWSELGLRAARHSVILAGDDLAPRVRGRGHAAGVGSSCRAPRRAGN